MGREASAFPQGGQAQTPYLLIPTPCQACGLRAPRCETSTLGKDTAKINEWSIESVSW